MDKEVLKEQINLQIQQQVKNYGQIDSQQNINKLNETIEKLSAIENSRYSRK